MDSRQWATLFRIIARAGDESEFSCDEEEKLMDMCADDESGLVQSFTQYGALDRPAFVAECKKLLAAPRKDNVVVKPKDKGQVQNTPPPAAELHGLDFKGLWPNFGISASEASVDQIEDHVSARPDTIFGLLIPKFDGKMFEDSPGWCCLAR